MAAVFDIEADGLLDEATKIHCFSYRTTTDSRIKTLYSYRKIIKFLKKQDVLIGHNIIRYDVPLLEKILGIKIKCKLIDTLALSWYLNHKRILHGLESYGVDYDRPKPQIDDWENLSIEEYTHRCEEDVWINSSLWFDLKKKLLRLYDNKKDADKLIDYLSFKLDCAREQEQSKWKIDLPKVEKHLKQLEDLQDKKVKELQDIMPPKIITDKRTKPSKPFKKDGTWSVHGAKWFNLLKEHNHPEDFDGEVVVEIGEEVANPNSPDQVKEWLFGLGWKPETFKYVKDGGRERAIPQVRKEIDGIKELCPSVLKLEKKEPSIKILEGLTIIQHRLSIFKNFFESGQSGWVKASIAGLTNTLRFKHKNPLVNLPGVSKEWGKEIRGCLIAPEGHVLCGSDMVSLEATTKRHYMFPFDPDYVKEMSDPNFDEHLDLAKQAGEISQEDILSYIKDKETFSWVKPVRSKFKPANYACVYGVQAPRLSRDTGLSKHEAQKLIDTYWKRNWSVKAACEEIEIKRIDGEMWLLNPVSGLYYSLRYERDVFSTLNQGTGVYCFDTWIKEWREVRPQLTGQFHDEIISCLPKAKEKSYEKILRDAIDRTNDKLKLNVKLDIDIQFGKNYAEIH